MMESETIKTSSKRIQQKLNTRQKILKAAELLFRKNGIKTTSTAEIAKEAGVAHGTLFVHFPTREDLITDVITFSLGSMSRRLHEETSGITNLKILLQKFCNGLQKYENFYKRILQEQHELPSVARSTLLGIYSAFSEKLYQAYKNEHEPEVEKSQLFITWISLINYYITNSDIYSDSYSFLEDKQDMVIAHFLKLI